MRHLLGLFLVVWLTGCGSVTVNTGAPTVGQPLEGTAWVFLWGLVGDTVDVPAHAGAARTQTYMNFGGWLVSFITFGIVQPIHVVAWPVRETAKPSPAK